MAGSVCFLLFLVTKHVPDGYIGIAGWTLAELPSAWYADLVTTFFGLPAADFFSADYFPLFPWLFLFATGFFLYHLLAGRGALRFFVRGHSRLLEWAGRHSLWIYLLHQPVIAVLLAMAL